MEEEESSIQREDSQEVFRIEDRRALRLEVQTNS